MKYVYIAKGNTDTVEGKGPMKNLAAFWDKKLAEECSSKEGGCMGMRMHHPFVDTLPVFDSVQDRSEYIKGDARRKALAKLTENDKVLLGLKDE